MTRIKPPSTSTANEIRADTSKALAKGKEFLQNQNQQNSQGLTDQVDAQGQPYYQAPPYQAPAGYQADYQNQTYQPATGVAPNGSPQPTQQGALPQQQPYTVPSFTVPNYAPVAPTQGANTTTNNQPFQYTPPWEQNQNYQAPVVGRGQSANGQF